MRDRSQPDAPTGSVATGSVATGGKPGVCRAALSLCLILAWPLGLPASGDEPASAAAPVPNSPLRPTPTASPLGRQVEDFELADAQGGPHRLSDFEQPIVVLAILGNECPLARLYAPRLEELHREFSPRGVAFLGINANSQDSLTELFAYVRSHGLTFPVVKDPGHHVADAIGAQRTPEVFVLDAERKVRYWGRIDDQYGIGVARPAPERQELRAALEDLLAGRPVSTREVVSVGCHIGRLREPAANPRVTYANQISRIFQKHCVECHRPGEIGPFSLTEYSEVAGWAEMIAEVIALRRMPPWHADPEQSHFANERLMTEEEQKLVYEWVATGAPEGDPADLPPPQEYVTGWRLSRPPEATVPMRDRPFTVPAEGVVPYQYFVVDPQFTEDKWVTAAEVIPGNRSVVHHVIVFFRAPEGVRQRGIGLLTGYVPGQGANQLPPGMARRVPAGSKLIFQMHYTPAGKPQDDLTSVGFLFADPKEVREEVVSMVAINRDFEIPAGAESFRVEASAGKFPAGARLLSIAPHMHVRGKAFHVDLRSADQAEPQEADSNRTLLDVPHYDFNWQHGYRLPEPLPLAGRQLDCWALFDNSDQNLANPDPGIAVRWGDQTWEEMMIAFFEVALPRDNAYAERQAGLTPEQERRAQERADQLFARFDKDGDGLLRQRELPDVVARFMFDDMDANGDRAVTPDEALEEARRAVRRRDSGSRP